MCKAKGKICLSDDCHLAGEVQPIENFGINKGYGDGRKARCKKCINKKYLGMAKDRERKIGKDYEDTMSTAYQRKIINSVSRNLSGCI